MYPYSPMTVPIETPWRDRRPETYSWSSRPCPDIDYEKIREIIKEEIDLSQEVISAGGKKVMLAENFYNSMRQFADLGRSLSNWAPPLTRERIKELVDKSEKYDRLMQALEEEE